MYRYSGGQTGFNETPEETLAIRDKLVSIARQNANTLDAGPCFEYPTNILSTSAAGYRGGCGTNKSGNIMTPSSFLTNGEYDNNLYGQGYRRRPARRRAHTVMRRRLGPRTVGTGRRRTRRRRATGKGYRRRRSTRGGSYKAFVRAHVNQMPGYTPQTRMRQVAAEWRRMHGSRLHPRGRALLY